MILVLGGTGYIGSFIVEYLKQCNFPYVSPSRHDLDVFNHYDVTKYINQFGCDFVINAIGYTGKPNVEACENNKIQCYRTNAVLPHVLSQACANADVPWGHISSGCIFNGYHSKYTEDDTPNFSFDDSVHSWYSGTKAHGEIAAGSSCYIWRVRMPISTVNNTRDYLNKLMSYERVLVAQNSITWIEQFVSNLPMFWTDNIPFGIYHMVATDPITSIDIGMEFDKHSISHSDKYVTLPEFDRMVSVPRSNCVLSNDKSIEFGAKWDTAGESVQLCLRNRVNHIRVLNYDRLGLSWDQR